MKLYFLEWDNGKEYSDHDVTLIGVFTSAAIRQAVRNVAEPMMKANNLRELGFIVETDVEADTNLIRAN